jgi:hypothetical protein
MDRSGVSKKHEGEDDGNGYPPQRLASCSWLAEGCVYGTLRDIRCCHSVP